MRSGRLQISWFVSELQDAPSVSDSGWPFNSGINSFCNSGFGVLGHKLKAVWARGVILPHRLLHAHGRPILTKSTSVD